MVNNSYLFQIVKLVNHKYWNYEYSLIRITESDNNININEISSVPKGKIILLV
jgi:hypothetical protein